jgi:hypothetical protein
VSKDFADASVSGAGLAAGSRVARFFSVQCTKARKKYTKLANSHKIYPIVVNYFKWPEYITTFSIPRSSKIYPN